MFRPLYLCLWSSRSDGWRLIGLSRACISIDRLCLRRLRLLLPCDSLKWFFILNLPQIISFVRLLSRACIAINLPCLWRCRLLLFNISLRLWFFWNLSCWNRLSRISDRLNFLSLWYLSLWGRFYCILWFSSYNFVIDF